LTELLVVIAILTVLTAVLLPVIRIAKDASKRTACLSNMHQAALASHLYFGDYDDRFMPINHQPAGEPNAQNDRTWVQMLLPYLKSFGVFHCPADHGRRHQHEGVFDQDLVPGDTYARYYSASQRTNLGYNYLYLAPVVRIANQWSAQPRELSMVNNTSQTILFVDSVWSRDSQGNPTGGGRWLVDPPCRYLATGSQTIDSFKISSLEQEFFTPFNGWKNHKNSDLLYGGAWPWHQGRMNVLRIDGSVRPLTPNQLTAGCQAQSNWQGLIRNPADYLWDLR
jgi:prepilin-type processing-associated H-X9-DG protein